MDLRVPREQFSRLTLRQFAALRKRWLDGQKRLDLRAGVLASTFANFSMNKNPDVPALQPYDFFPSLEQPDMPDTDISDAVLAIFSSIGNSRSN